MPPINLANHFADGGAQRGQTPTYTTLCDDGGIKYPRQGQVQFEKAFEAISLGVFSLRP